MRFAIYSQATGEIKKIFTGPGGHLDKNTPDGLSAVPIDSGDDSTHYVDITAAPHTIIEKTPIGYTLDTAAITANGSDAATISALPDGTSGYLDGVEYAPTSGALTIIADLAGIYKIELRHPLYLPTFVEITAA